MELELGCSRILDVYTCTWSAAANEACYCGVRRADCYVDRRNRANGRWSDVHCLLRSSHARVADV